MRYLAVVLGCILVAACDDTPRPGSGDVPTYRGDSARTGVMPGPGPSGEGIMRWEFHASGPIRSSPAVGGDTAFVVSIDGVVHAVWLSTGAERWASPLHAEAGAATPLVLGGRVVVGDRAGVVHALAIDTGAELWTTTLDGPIAGAAASAGDRVLTATDAGTAYALDPSTGTVIWRTVLPGKVSHSIAATESTAYYAVDGGLLVALRTADGSIIWQAQVASDGDGGTPTAAGGLVFAATGLGSTDLDARALVALDPSTGEVRWRYVSPDRKVVYAPAVVDGRAYAVAEDERVVALEAATGKLIWSVTTGAPNDALPSIWGLTIYVPTTGGSMQARHRSSGELVWQVPITGVPYAAVVTGGLVLVATNVGVLYAIGDGQP